MNAKTDYCDNLSDEYIGNYDHINAGMATLTDSTVKLQHAKMTLLRALRELLVSRNCAQACTETAVPVASLQYRPASSISGERRANADVFHAWLVLFHSTAISAPIRSRCAQPMR